ncbi:MAG: hypothetical protein M3N08_00185 [Pseudomonadota bacterium]|nr:hypothetical protein [Pseudomonadota bacterium]
MRQSRDDMLKNVIALALAALIAVAVPRAPLAGEASPSGYSPIADDDAPARGIPRGDSLRAPAAGALTSHNQSHPMGSGRSTAYAPRGYVFVPAPTPAATAYVPDLAVLPARPAASIYASERYGSYCRQFSQRVRIGDHIEESYGTACMQPDGTWRITP